MPITKFQDFASRTNLPPNIQTFGYDTSVTTANYQYHSTGTKRSYQDPKTGNVSLSSRLHSTGTNKSSSFVPKDVLQASKVIKSSEDTVSPKNDLAKPRFSTPGATQAPELSLAHPAYNLPCQLVQNFRSLGVTAIYPWQSKCLLASGVLRKSINLVYTAPTGGGKSLVADIVLLKRIIENPHEKALVVLPYVALVQEKTKWLRRLAQDLIKKEEQFLPFRQSRAPSTKDVRVTSFFGGHKVNNGFLDCDIAVCTTEKANSIINTAIEGSYIDELGVVVLDELHMLDDPHRGYIMELMVTKLMLLQNEIQIVGMSATLPNPELLAKWLKAKFFVATYRPIPIEEHLVYDNQVYPTANTKEFLRTASQLSSPDPTQKPAMPSCTIEKSVHKELASPITNAVVALAVENVSHGFGSLVFCSSRQGAQDLATLISQTMSVTENDQAVLNKRIDVLASLQALPSGFDTTFNRTIPYGVAFHHAGLTTEEREIVAEAYDTGVLKVMVATCSLAAGVNLPARRVILHGARMGRDLVGPSMLRQMRGRAGRKGKDEVGETYLCCQKSDLEDVASLLEAEIPSVASSLTSEKRGIGRAILEVIAIRLANSFEGLRDYMTCSLLWHTTEHNTVLEALDQALTQLIADKLVELIAHGAYVPTPLGSAVVAAGLTPEDGLFVHSDLRRALSSFVMDSELHLFYLFTPIPQTTDGASITADISFPVFRDLIDTLDEPSINALRRIGVDPAQINRLANSGVERLPERTAKEINIARVYRRVYSTFALRDFCNETPIHQISSRYKLSRGTIQTLAQTCHGFAAGMIKFCQRMAQQPTSTQYNNAFLPSTYASSTQIASAAVTPDPQAGGFSMLAAVLEHMQSRLYAGARADLLEMTEVSFVKGRMARLLYDSGFKSIRSLAEADPRKDILPVMWSAFGWKMRRPTTEASDTTAGAGAGGQDAQENYDVRKQKLEEKLLQKIEVMVASASRIQERDVLQIAADLDE